ncbi:MAG: hypothetical protein E7618_07140 [Ruminococcaceae bacterium]|nr:hypothetical protein [Oscillospiraceae bacterium]
MTAWYILLGIAAFFFFVAMLRITVILRLEDAFGMTVRLCGIPILVLPKREAPPSLRRFRIRRFRRWRRKEQKKYLKRRLSEQAAQKKKEQKKKETAAEDKPKRSLKENVAYGVDLVRYVIGRALSRFGRYLRIDVYRIEVAVGGGEPDKVAVAYGAVCQSVSYLQALLDQHLNVRYPNKEKTVLAVTADFLAEKTVVHLHLALSIRLWQVVAVALAALFGYLKMPKHEPKAKKKDGPSSSDSSDLGKVPEQKNNTNTSQSPVTSGQEVS